MKLELAKKLRETLEAGIENGKAVTECVTVNGAIRRIETMERLSNANDSAQPPCA